jgi:dTMP kinase
MIVSFSGIDSAGKTTQIELLHEYCKTNKIGVKKVWSKARGTPGVLLLKELVRRDKKMDAGEKAEYRKDVFRNPKKQKLLYVASMLDLCWYWGIWYRILGALTRVLICDRYLWDTYAEIKQDFPCVDIDRSKLWKIVKALAPKPKVSFVFMIPAEVSLARDRQKNAAGIEDISVKEKKIATYSQCVKDGRWSHVMDGMDTIENLHNQVLKAVGLQR